jgi:hypothetical protein
MQQLDLDSCAPIALDYRALAMEEPTPLFVETKHTLKMG